MMTTSAVQHIRNHLAAVRRAIDPHRALLAASTPYVVAGGVGPAEHNVVMAGMHAANTVDADYIHLEFVEGREHEGPANVVVAMVRDGVGHVGNSCRFWEDADGNMALVCSADGRHATMTFAHNGADSNPGAPADDLAPGFARAAARLRELAEDMKGTDELVVFTLDRAA